MEQKPSLGRIVIFVLGDSQAVKDHVNNYGNEAPAIITRVFDGETGMVNMKVLLDGIHDRWVTSVKYSEEPTPYSWHWPARV